MSTMNKLGKYQPYPDYKDSGVEWLGEIPIHWRQGRLGTFGYFSAGCGFPNELQGEKNGKYPFFKVSDTNLVGNEKYLHVAENYISEKTAKNLGAKIHRAGGILFPKVGAALLGNKRRITTIPSISDNNTIVYFPYESEYLYWYYWLIQVDFGKLSNPGPVPSINESQLKDFVAISPTFDERKTIAAFLDYETARIDQLIARQKQLIELLKEKRQAVISHAVTKGLNPNAPMKDSGVEWLGQVPEHWDVLPTKRFFRMVAKPAPENNEYELLSVYTDIGVRPRKELEQKGNKASTTDGYWLVKKGDVVVNKLLAWMGAVGYSNYNGVTSPAYDILRATKNINPKFYHYLFRSNLAQREFKRWSRGIMEMRLRLYFDELGRIQMPMPCKSEQDSVVNFIEKMELQFDEITDKATKQITLLQERRTALISAAVTGKIDLRGWQPPKSEVAA